MRHGRLHVEHPYIARANHAYQTARARYGDYDPRTLEAREAIAHHEVSALVDLLTGRYTRNQLRTLLNRLDDALLEFEPEPAEELFQSVE